MHYNRIDRYMHTNTVNLGIHLVDGGIWTAEKDFGQWRSRHIQQARHPQPVNCRTPPPPALFLGPTTSDKAK